MRPSPADGLVRRRHLSREPDYDLVSSPCRRLAARAANDGGRFVLAFPPTKAWRRSTTLKMAFIALLHAGVRALDIRDPYHPPGVGYFIPSSAVCADSAWRHRRRCPGSLQGRDPDQQWSKPTSRLYLHLRPRQHRIHILELSRPRPAPLPGFHKGGSSPRAGLPSLIASWHLAPVGGCAYQKVRPLRSKASTMSPLAGNRLAVPRDGWPAGRRLPLRWRSCGADIELYVRP